MNRVTVLHLVAYIKNALLYIFRHNQYFADADDISINMQERARNKCFNAVKPYINDPEDKHLGYHVKVSKNT